MKNILASLFLLLPAIGFSQMSTISNMAFTIGEQRIVHSKILDEDRTLNISLPLGYDSTKSYPVLYLLDGSADEDFMHIVGLTQFYNLMYKMPETIVVGIANVDRKRDFTFPTLLLQLRYKYPSSGQSKKFIGFLKEELQPYIDKTYKTTNDKYLIGQSLGGLVATEILLKDPTLFTHYFIISPSMWWDNESMLKKADKLIAKHKGAKAWVYISVGGDEGDIMIRGAKGVYDALSAAKNPNMHLEYYLNDKADHATILHSSIMEGFRRLFPPKY